MFPGGFLILFFFLKPSILKSLLQLSMLDPLALHLKASVSFETIVNEKYAGGMKPVAHTFDQDLPQGLKLANVISNRINSQTASIEEEEAKGSKDLLVLDRSAPVLIPEDDLFIKCLVHLHSTDAEPNWSWGGVLDLQLLLLRLQRVISQWSHLQVHHTRML